MNLTQRTNNTTNAENLLSLSMVPTPPIIQPEVPYAFKLWPKHAFDLPVEVIPGVWISGAAFTNDIGL